MTCPETSELLSALLDGTLDVREREQVEAHLAGCSDCRRELAGLRSTVSLLARVERARAPLGFVDKVMGEVYPDPWYRRLGRLVFLPLSVKLPIEAGAMVVIAILGVYLLQGTPELRDAARPDVPAVASRPDAPASPPPADAPSKEREAKIETGNPPARDGESSRGGQPVEEAQPPAETRQNFRNESLGKVAPLAEGPAKPETPAARSAAPKALDSREGSADRAEGDRQRAAGAAPAAPSVSSAKQQAAPAMVSGVLTVKDRSRAEQSLADLISRTGARETGKRREGSVTVVDVTVPQASYVDFVRELASLGSVRLEGEPDPAAAFVQLGIRIAE